MATLTEKQQMIKQVLGSTESIRKFVQDEGISIIDLKGYISRLEAVEKVLEESKKKEAKRDALTKLDSIRAELALNGFSKDEIDNILGAGGSGTDDSGAKRGGVKGVVRPKYIFPLLDGSSSEPISTVGNRKEDSPVMQACKAKGYSKLSEWVIGDNISPV